MINRSHLIAATSVVLAACSSPPQSADIPTLARDCASLNSLTGLRVYVLGGRGFDEFRFDGGGMTRSEVGADVATRIVENDPHVRESLDNRFPGEITHLPSGENLAWPAARTDDKQKFAATLRKDAYKSDEVVIRNGKSQSRASSFAGFSIYSLTWSPEGNALAVLQRNYDNAPRSLLDLVSPHGVQYSDILLTVFSPSGDLQCQALLVKNRHNAQSAIEWTR